MADPYLGQITQIAFAYAPRGYAYCDGATLQVSQNAALNALLGSTFGGDGRTTFMLPDLRGRVPVHQDWQTIQQGKAYGAESVALTLQTIPQHTHNFVATTTNGDQGFAYPAGAKTLANAVLATTKEAQLIYGQPTSNLIPLNPNTTTSVGGGQAHSNLQPSLVIGFIIALQGIFPSRN